MAGTFSTTAGIALRWLKGTSLVSDIDEGFQRLAEDCASKLLGYSQGTAEERPAAGVPNRLWKNAASGAIYHDTGSAWEQMLRGADSPIAASASYALPASVSFAAFPAAQLAVVNLTAVRRVATPILLVGMRGNVHKSAGASSSSAVVTLSVSTAPGASVSDLQSTTPPGPSAMASQALVQAAPAVDSLFYLTSTGIASVGSGSGVYADGELQALGGMVPIKLNRAVEAGETISLELFGYKQGTGTISLTLLDAVAMLLG